MTNEQKKEIEKNIMKKAKELSSYADYGEYTFLGSLKEYIADQLGYDTYRTWKSVWWSDLHFRNPKEEENTDEVIKRMVKRGLITLSKRGTTFKVNY